jgi:hypothetical protein
MNHLASRVPGHAGVRQPTPTAGTSHAAEARLGGGHPLDPATRTTMERRFGHDFGAVRVHADPAAARAAAARGAQAYTAGDDVVFGAGRYAPFTPRGHWLLAHELAHVAQRRPGGPVASNAAVEEDARRAATDALAGQPVRVAAQHDGSDAYCFGEPENVPDLTYVSTSGAPTFLDQAAEFHEAWGLKPKRVDSIQAVVDDLATNTTALARVRIVTHAVDRGILMPLFTGEGKATTLTTARLSAHAESEEAGLGFESELNIGAATVDEITADVRTANAAVLKPFGLDQSGSPTGSLTAFVRRVIMLEWLGTMRTTANAAQVDPLVSATQKLLPILRAAVVRQFAPAATSATATPPAPAVTATQVNDLEQEIGAAASAYRASFSFDRAQIGKLQAATKAAGGGFRDRLTAARTRFSADSWIDIRGCNAGDDLGYLRAVSRFFGRADAAPHVSGPDWFEVFPIFGSRSVRDEKAIEKLAANTSVQEAVERWAPLTGVRLQMESLRLFYQSEILRRERLEAMQRPRKPDLGARDIGPVLPPFPQLKLSPLAGGLPTPPADRLAVMLLMEPGPAAPVQSGLTAPAVPAVSVLGTSLEDPALGLARRALERLRRPNAELFYYLQAGLLLPVFIGPHPQAIYFYYLDALAGEAVTHWLGSQWAAETPGLEGIAKQGIGGSDPRRVQGLVEHRPEEPSPPGSRILFPPDPEYWTHIQSV